jgi:hypothetical protein
LKPIYVSEDVLSQIADLARCRGTDIAGVVAEALGLETALVQAQQNNGRLLLEQRGRVRELIPPDHQRIA